LLIAAEDGSASVFLLLTIHRMAGEIRRMKKDLLGQAGLPTALTAISPRTFPHLVTLVLWVHKIIASPAFWDCFALLLHMRNVWYG